MIDKNKLLISDTEYYDNSIERLANEANNSNEYALKRLSPRELKQKMMLPAKMLTEHLNALVMIMDGLDAGGRLTEDSLLGLLQTGIPSHPNLYKLLIGFKDGSLPSAIKIDNLKTLQTLIDSVSAMLEAYEKGEIGGGDDVYILSKGETLADAPTNADVVIDPYGEATPAVVSINGIKPDASGNINLPIYNGEVEAV